MSLVTKYWVWGVNGPYYGMPILNLVGWYVTGLALMIALSALRADRWIALLPLRWLVAFYGANLLLPLGMSAAAGLWGAVAATTGILRTLSERELRGVMAHELTHVKHRDILISTISATMAGAISMLANFAMFFGHRDENGRSANPIVGLLVMLLAPLAASLIQMAISRAREFEADRGGAELSGDPQALAAALQKIQRAAQGIPLAAAERHPETAQMMITNPLSGGGLRGLFSTHPSTEERVERLLAMAGAMRSA